MKLCLKCNLEFTDELTLCPKDDTKLVQLSEDLLLGTVIQERYRIESVIGRGSMGIVYKAVQELISRDVAVKVLHSHLVSDSESLKRFHQQAKAASRLNHPNIITVYDYGILQGGRPYVVMDLLKGTSLAQLLEEKHHLSPEEALPLFRQVCEALSEAHSHGVVHRDVKPDNIVLETQEGGTIVKVVDFGIAKLIQSKDETLTRITRTGTVCGSPAYMSPEQYRGSDHVDHRSDIYSVGAVLFETLTGQLPFTSPDLISLMGQHISEPAPKMSTLLAELKSYPALEQLVDRALSKDVKLRQQTMGDLIDEIDAAIKNKSKSRKAGDTPQPGPPEEEPVSEAEIQAVVAAHLTPKPINLAEAAGVTVISAGSRSRTDRFPRPAIKIPISVRLVSLGQVTLPYLVAALLLVVLFNLVMHNEKVEQAVDEHLAPALGVLGMGSAQDPRQLVLEGKLGQARQVLERRRKKAKLSASESELLSKIYLQLADREARAKNYRAAAKLVEQVPPRTSQYARARALLRAYRRLSGS